MTENEFIEAIIKFLQGAERRKPYQRNAIERVATATDQYVKGKFTGKL